MENTIQRHVIFYKEWSKNDQEVTRTPTVLQVPINTILKACKGEELF